MLTSTLPEAIPITSSSIDRFALFVVQTLTA